MQEATAPRACSLYLWQVRHCCRPDGKYSNQDDDGGRDQAVLSTLAAVGVVIFALGRQRLAAGRNGTRAQDTVPLS